VQHVVSFELEPKLVLKIEMVQGVVGDVVKQIPNHKANKKQGHDLFSQYIPKGEIEQKCQRNAHCRGHD